MKAEQGQQQQKVQQKQKQSQQTTQQQDAYSDVSKQELVVMLKQKIKENKAIQNKNNKLQTKYVDIFRQHKNIKNDHTIFLAVFKVIFKDFQQKPYGTYKLEILEDMWIKRQQKFNQKLMQLMDQTNQQKVQLQKKFKQQIQKKLQQTDSSNQTQLNNILIQNQNLKKNNKTLINQINDFDKRVEQQINEISRLTKQKLKLQHDFNQIRMKQFTDQLNNNNQQDLLKKKQSSQRNQFLGLRQQVQTLLSVRDQAKRQIKELKNQIKLKDKSLIQKNQQIHKLTQQLNKSRIPPQSPMEKAKQHQSVKHQQQSKSASKQKVIKVSSINNKSQQNMPKSINLNNKNVNISEEDMIHRQYLKNVLVRYFKSLNQGDQARSQILLNVIVTILKFTNSQIGIVNEKRKSWWNLY